MATIVVLIIVAILRTDSNLTPYLPWSRVHVTFLILIVVLRQPRIRLELSKMSAIGHPIRDQILSQAKSWSTTCFKQSAVFIISIVLSFIALLILHLAFGISLAFRTVFTAFHSSRFFEIHRWKQIFKYNLLRSKTYFSPILNASFAKLEAKRVAFDDMFLPLDSFKLNQRVDDNVRLVIL